MQDALIVIGSAGEEEEIWDQAAGVLNLAGYLPTPDNLIVNGDAEGGAGSASGFDVIAAPGWTTVGSATVVQYGIGGGFPATTDPGPVSRGLNFFAGGPNNAASSMNQLLDVSSSAGSIDSGLVAFALEGFLGGFSSQRDNAVLTASFLDGLSGVLGSASIGPVSNTDRSDLTGLLARSTNGIVPVGTRGIQFDLSHTRVDGSYDDGYADNLSLILRGPETENGVPEPATLLLLASGLTACGVVVRRRRP
jgi:hypothetical protein